MRGGARFELLVSGGRLLHWPSAGNSSLAPICAGRFEPAPICGPDLPTHVFCNVVPSLQMLRIFPISRS